MKSIPFWRMVKYTDDGCAIFQCLNCYKGWESRTGPISFDAQYNWVFCPYCGIQWKGEKENSINKWEKFCEDRPMESARAFANRLNHSKTIEWQIQERLCDHKDGRIIEDWHNTTKSFCSISFPRELALSKLRELRREEAEYIKRGITFGLKSEFKLVPVKVFR